MTRLELLWALALCAGACRAAGPTLPWASLSVATAPGEPHAEVRTLNPAYDRLHSHVLVREIDRPTRANLDYAAYHANFMLVEEPPEPAAESGERSAGRPFAGQVDATTLTADFARTPLSEVERKAPLAFAPLSEFALARKVAGASALEQLGSAVRGESWGGAARPGSASQTIAEVYLHGGGGAKSSPELWLKIEFAPWFRALGSLPDYDRDGVAEVYARMQSPLSPELAQLIEHEYRGRLLDTNALKAWANQLASYWYPSFNTDLAPAADTWPDSQTEAEIRAELSGGTYARPSVVVRGKPLGQPTYDVFLVKGLAEPVALAQSGPAPKLERSAISPNPQLTAARIAEQLAAFGGASWAGWDAQLAPFHAALRRRLAAQPHGSKALAGTDGFLFFRTSLQSVVGGEIAAQRPGKNPLPVIVEWKNLLARHGVDFLFVPVPSKIEIFPDKLEPTFSRLAGQVVHPHLRKFLASLTEQGVEVLDLLTPLLAARVAGDDRDLEPLYQRQDTHWSDRGLRLAADALSERIRQYPWYAQLPRAAQPFAVHETSFTRLGDLHARLPEALKKQYQPETLRAQQVVRADGSLYEDDPDSPITVLGDSFTGVYELTDAEHAGFSAHVARGISHPVDLVMSYGGGPNVRHKLMRRGEAALDQKKLIVWVMAARDLYDYWEEWQPLQKP